MSFTVAIIGRPNVGKSTLFNRLVGKRLAIVDDLPGVTRDRREGKGRLGDIDFKVIDTAGMEEAETKSLETRMFQQTERALEESDVTLFLVDVRAGITPMDAHFARWLRKQKTPLILVVNKCEGRGRELISEAYSLGIGEPIGISAEHGEGLGELYDALLPYEKSGKEEDEGAILEVEDENSLEDEGEEEGRPLRLAVVGRPNVGKSTLINKILGEERVLTGPEPGITRDSILIPWVHEGRAVELVDTAGLRRKSKIIQRIEKMSTVDTRRTIRLTQVAILVLDATMPMEKQDLTIARLIVDEGRAMVIVLNKWDLVRDGKKTLQMLNDRLETSLPQIRGVPIVHLSALSGKNMQSLMRAVFDIYEIWNKRIATARLNRWLESIVGRHPPPAPGGRRLKLRYMTQVKARPPTFSLFVNKPKDIPESYLRYLVNGLRESFGLSGVPIRINMRKGDNPFTGK